MVTPLWPLDGKPTYSRKAPPVSKFCGWVVWSGVVAVFGVKNADMTAVTAVTTRGLYLIPIYISPYFSKGCGQYGQKGPPAIRKPPLGRPHVVVVNWSLVVALLAHAAHGSA